MHLYIWGINKNASWTRLKLIVFIGIMALNAYKMLKLNLLYISVSCNTAIFAVINSINSINSHQSPVVN